jgi:ATP-dependent protease HslVU (ClpYQ) peptidase subunit
MTCIVAVKDSGKVYMGADSLGSNYHSKSVRIDEKIFKKGKMLFGFTSSFRMGQILNYSFNPPKHDPKLNDMEYLVDQFVPELIKTYEKNKWLKTEASVVSGGVFLLAYNGEIYKIESDFQVNHTFDNYNACGSGADAALGSLFTTEKYRISPKDRINHAIEAASHHIASVGGPIHIMSI